MNNCLGLKSKRVNFSFHMSPRESSPSNITKNKNLCVMEGSNFLINVIHLPTYPYKCSSEYAVAINHWLWQCYNFQCLTNAFPLFVGPHTAYGQTSPGTVDLNRNFPNNFIPNQNLFFSGYNRINEQAQRQNSERNQGVEYLIPSLWRRFAAEVIDFFILLILKVLITYIAVDFFDLISLDKYDFDLLKNDKMDYHKAMEVTSEIIALEVIHRFVVCIFEALCLHKGISGAGGATPGKSIMQLKVVSCYSVTAVDSNKVKIYPAGDLGFGWALLRAFIKNFSLAFIFPICFTMFFFQHNRTAYDIICNSIVVEDIPQRLPRN